MGKKCLCIVFQLTRRSRVHDQNNAGNAGGMGGGGGGGASYSTSNKFLLVARCTLATGLPL